MRDEPTREEAERAAEVAREHVGQWVKIRVSDGIITTHHWGTVVGVARRLGPGWYDLVLEDADKKLLAVPVTNLVWIRGE